MSHHVSDVVAAVIAILLLIMTFIYAWMVMRNFGRGLKDQSMSTIRPFQHLLTEAVLQSHGNRRPQVEGTVHTRRCLPGRTG
jgi:hypothetical protein